MIIVTATFDTGYATSIGCASMGAALDTAEGHYDMLGCREVIVKDEQSGKAWEYVGARGGFTMCPIGEEE